MTEEPEITTMGEKGQVVIPKSVREHLNVKPQTKFLIFGRGDYIMLKRLELPDVREEWQKVFASAARKGLDLSEADVAGEIDSVRRERRKKSKR